MGDTAGLVTLAVETAKLRPEIERTREIAAQFAAAACDPIPASCITAAGFEVARAAIRLLDAELDDHEQRIVDGLASDATKLQSTVERYEQNETATVRSATRLAEAVG